MKTKLDVMRLNDLDPGDAFVWAEGLHPPGVDKLIKIRLVDPRCWLIAETAEIIKGPKSPRKIETTPVRYMGHLTIEGGSSRQQLEILVAAIRNRIVDHLRQIAHDLAYMNPTPKQTQAMGQKLELLFTSLDACTSRAEILGLGE